MSMINDVQVLKNEKKLLSIVFVKKRCIGVEIYIYSITSDLDYLIHSINRIGLK